MEEEEEEIPSTAGEKKRANDEASPDSPPAKKLCTEETGETSNVPCEVRLSIITPILKATHP